MSQVTVLDHEAGGCAGISERDLIIEALIEVAAERGYIDTTIEHVLEHAGVDRDAFDHHFRGKHDCFLTAWQQINEECLLEMMRAYNGQRDWLDRIRAVAREIVEGLRQDHSRASFAVEVLAAGGAARARRDMTMRVVASLIDAGRSEMEDPDSVSHTTAEALAGSAYGQIYSKVARGETDDLPSLVPQLISTVAMPYLGIEVALEELSRAPGAQARYGRNMAKEPIDKSSRLSSSKEDYPPELARLPPGRHGLPREFVTRNQRERLIAGIAEAIAEHGYAGTTIAHITRAAAVSRRTFYEHFSGKDECFVVSYETVMDELRERISEAFDEADDWPHAVKAGISAMLAFLAGEPNLARLCMVEALVAGPVVVERYDAAIRSFVPYFRQGRDGQPPEVLARLSPTTEDALAGGMVSLISRRIIAGQTTELEDLLPDLVEFTLTPYLGTEEATRIAKED